MVVMPTLSLAIGLAKTKGSKLSLLVSKKMMFICSVVLFSKVQKKSPSAITKGLKIC